ncbi:MAG: ribulose-phosphate 3-epimerase [Actinomycetales bacterium]
MEVRICPSVLNADLSRLAEEVGRVAGVCDFVHLDVMDNHFVPNLTFGLPVVASLLASGDIEADCHLMIEDPDRWAPAYAEVGAASVTFHLEAARDPVRICRDLRGAGARAGIAVKPATDAAALAGLMDSLDMVLVMTVEPGFGRQAFIPQMLAKVQQVRRMADATGTDIWIQVDGGVSESTIEACAQAGADAFVAGSAVFGSDDPAAMVQRLRMLAQGASEQASTWPGSNEPGSNG